MERGPGSPRRTTPRSAKIIELRVRPEAELDAFAAALWYESDRPGLGVEFVQTVRRTFRRIEERPLQFPVISADVRRAIFDRFPFGAFFVVDGAASTVIAIMHLHRDPNSWRMRSAGKK